MKKQFALVLVVFFFTLGCQDQDEQPQPVDFGYLSLNVTLTIAKESVSGRLEAVNTDNFRVTIFKADGTPQEIFDPFSDAPVEIQLPTGEYYVEAHSNNNLDAAFENPYYFGRSANFTVDKEETKAIDVNAELANTKVAINYSTNVTGTFQSYTGSVTRGTVTLDYIQGETRPGYFAVGSPLNINVDLEYTKLDGSIISRNFTTTIDDPQPKTQYNINVDAVLEDGVISLNINVDESFNEVEIIIGDNSGAPTTFALAYGGALDDFGYSMDYTQDGGYVLAGSSMSSDNDVTSNNGGFDYWVVKVDENGTVQWESNFGGTGNDHARGIAQLTDGSYVVSGYSNSTDGDASTNYGDDDAWLIKLDINGNLVWQATLGTTYGDRAMGLEATDDGGFVVTGHVDINTYSNLWIAKFDAINNLEWENHYGGIFYEIGYNISSTADGGYIACGYSNTDGTSFGSDSYYVVKVDNLGNLQWETRLGGSNSEYAWDVVELSSQYVVVGYSRSADGDVIGNNGTWDSWIVGLDDNGNLLWNRNYGGSQNDLAYSVTEDGSGGLTIAGSTTSTDGDVSNNIYGNSSWIINVDGSGNLLWERSLQGKNAHEILLSNDGGYVIGGSSYTGYNNKGSDDFTLWKTDSQGNIN